MNEHSTKLFDESVARYTIVYVPATKSPGSLPDVRNTVGIAPELSVAVGIIHDIGTVLEPTGMTLVISLGQLANTGGVVSTGNRRRLLEWIKTNLK